MIGHAGSLSSKLQEAFEPPFQPVGATDTEVVFCSLLSRIAARGWRSLADTDPRVLHGWLLIHVPVSIALLVLGGIHAIVALRY